MAWFFGEKNVLNMKCLFNFSTNFDILLTVHLSIILAVDQLIVQIIVS